MAKYESNLVLNKGFTPDGAALFVKVLRENIEFASISVSDYKGVDTGTQRDGSPRENTVSEQLTARRIPPPSRENSQYFTGTIPHNEKVEGDILSFNISRTGKAQVRFNGQITQEAIKRLIAHLDLSLDAYPTQAELVQPQKAIWRNKDHDQPVTVIGEAGDIDGKRFLKIQGSETGIPADDVEFEE